VLYSSVQKYTTLSVEKCRIKD